MMWFFIDFSLIISDQSYSVNTTDYKDIKRSSSIMLILLISAESADDILGSVRADRHKAKSQGRFLK